MILNWDYFSEGNKVVACKNHEEANACIKMAESHGYAPWEYERYRYFRDDYIFFGVRKDRNMWFFTNYEAKDWPLIPFNKIVISCDVDKSELSKILDLC